jgi:hypothetical protein
VVSQVFTAGTITEKTTTEMLGMALFLAMCMALAVCYAFLTAQPLTETIVFAAAFALATFGFASRPFLLTMRINENYEAGDTEALSAAAVVLTQRMALIAHAHATAVAQETAQKVAAAQAAVAALTAAGPVFNNEGLPVSPPVPVDNDGNPIAPPPAPALLPGSSPAVPTREALITPVVPAPAPSTTALPAAGGLGGASGSLKPPPSAPAPAPPAPVQPAAEAMSSESAETVHAKLLLLHRHVSDYKSTRAMHCAHPSHLT